MTSKGWIIFATLCVAILGGMIFMAQKDKMDVSAIDVNKIQAATAQSGDIADHTEGKTDSKVVLIEYGDFQCPGCASAQPVMKALVEKYKDKMTFVFRNYPLYQAHPNAFSSASAAEAAGLQGKYWEMYHKLYENHSAWRDLSGSERTNYYLSLASDLELDTAKFTTDIDSDAVKKKIDFDTALGQKAKVTGTPSFYMNGKNVGDQYVLDGKIVAKGTSGASLIWSDAAAFENLIILPALKEAGISVADPTN